MLHGSRMKIIKKVLLLLLIAVVLFSAIEIIGTLLLTHYYGKPVTSWQEYNFSFRERQQLKKHAKNLIMMPPINWEMYYERLAHDDKKAIGWLKIAAEGNHVEANRELVKYGLFYYDSIESDKIMEECVKRLKELALSEMKPENFYMKDLEE